jgi:hypothetical protein
MLKKTFFVLAASLPIFGYSDDAYAAETYCLLPPEPVESCQLPIGYFYPAQYILGDCCVDIYAAAEFIYWEANHDSLSFIGRKNIFNATTGIDVTTLVHHQGYRPGFKVAVGMGFPGIDNWNCEVEYTWFHHTTTNHFSAPANGFIQPSFLTDAFAPALFGLGASALRSKQKFDLDFLQATLGRSFYLSQRLVVDAGVGLKGWWSTANTDLLFTIPGGFQGSQLSKNRLWGIGPYVKANIKALLWCGTYLFGKAGIFPSYTRFTKVHINNNFPTVGFIRTERVSDFTYLAQLFYEGAIGLGWGSYFCDCGYHVDFSIGYDMMTNYIRGLSISTGQTFKEFYYQGLSIKAQLDF